MNEKETKLVIAAALHDIGKVIYREGSDSRKHSISGYDYLKDEAGITDKEILDAVKSTFFKFKQPLKASKSIFFKETGMVKSTNPAFSKAWDWIVSTLPQETWLKLLHSLNAS